MLATSDKNPAFVSLLIIAFHVAHLIADVGFKRKHGFIDPPDADQEDLMN